MTQQIALGGASFARLDKLKHVPRGGKPQTVFTTEARSLLSCCVKSFSPKVC
jgi:hypothetical protein